MKPDIHPEYNLITVHCACGNQFRTRSTQADIHVEICSVCHPYFTGKQRLMDTAGRVERFRQKWGSDQERAGGAKKAAATEAPPAKAAAESPPAEQEQQEV